MASTAKPDQTRSPDNLVARGDDKSTTDYDKIVREELARVQERLARLAAPSPPPMPSPVSLDTSVASAALDQTVTAFRATAVNDLPGAPAGARAPKQRFMRSLTGLLVSAGIIGAALAWSAYGEAARATFESLSPQLASIVSLASEKLGLSKQPSVAAAPRGAAADAAPAQAPAAEVNAPQAASAAPAPAQAAAPAESTPAAPDSTQQLLQGMARDLASLTQAIDELKANQQQILRDNARLVEQLKASQEQVARVARVSESSLHPRPVAAPKPVPPAIRRPVPPTAALPPPQMIAPPQAAALPPAPPPLPEEAPPTYVPRPPNPVP
jgi:hypothetical protein